MDGHTDLFLVLSAQLFCFCCSARGVKVNYKYQFGTDDSGGYPDFDIECIWRPEDMDYIAQECAEKYFSEHDGWESSWPLTFTIFKDGKQIGRARVEMESEPQFYSTII